MLFKLSPNLNKTKFLYAFFKFSLALLASNAILIMQAIKKQ